MDMVLEFKDLYRSLDQRRFFVRESGSLEAGQILSVKGASGSGKSTLLRMLARTIKAESGDVYWRGRHWFSIAPGAWRCGVHYVAQKPVMFGGTVEDNFRLPFTLREMKEHTSFSPSLCAQYMRNLGLPGELLKQPAQTLSGGEAARVALIRALMIEPEVLLLDEPGAYLDSNSRTLLVNLLADWVQSKAGRAIVMVSHNDDNLDILNNVSTLHMGASRGVQND